MRQPQQDWKSTPFGQKVEAGKQLVYLSALPIICIWRKDLGYRFINVMHLWGVTGLLALISYISAPGNPDKHFDHLLIFAAVALFCGLVRRNKALRDIKRGLVLHTYYIGNSPYASKKPDSFVSRNRIVERFLDPLVWLILGLCVFTRSPALGFWWIYSAFCLLGFEAMVHKRHEQMKLDVMDSMIVSQHQSEIAREFEQPPQQYPLQPPTGVPTGMAPDVAKSLKRRKAK